MIPRASWLAAAVLAWPLGGAAQPAGDAITLFCSGGVTGGGGGTRIGSDGDVTRLRMPRAGAPMEREPAGHAPSGFERISALLDAAGFDSLPRGAPGNRTCVLTRMRGGLAHEVTWADGRAPVALGPALEAIAAAAR